MTAWGSLAREVPRRNLRRWVLVSSEKVYSLASALCLGGKGEVSVRVKLGDERRGVGGEVGMDVPWWQLSVTVNSLDRNSE